MDYLRSAREEFSVFFEDYDRHLAQLKKNGVWGDHLCLVALARVLDAQILIHQFERPTFVIQPQSMSSATRTIQLGYVLDEHYLSVESAESASQAVADAVVAKADALAEAKAAAPSRAELICMQQGGTDDLELVRKLLSETDHDIDAVVEILIAEQMEQAAFEEQESKQEGESESEPASSVSETASSPPTAEEKKSQNGRISAAEKRRAKEIERRQKKLAKTAAKAMVMAGARKREVSPLPADQVRAAAPAVII